jgi:hypothetical protein
MSPTNPTSPPALSSIEEEESQGSTLSGWAVLALIVGLSSLIVPVSIQLIPLSLLAIVVGVLVAFRLRRTDTGSGLWMATACLGLGIATASWALAAHKTRNDYLAARASEFAVEYMELLSQGLFYNAIELKLPFSQRQSSDVDLQAYYEAYTGEIKIDLSLGDVVGFDDSEPSNLEKARKTAVERLKIDVVTRLAMQYPESEWKVVEILKVASRKNQAVVQVALATPDDPRTKVVIDLVREQIESEKLGDLAEWRIANQELSN